MSIHNPQAAEQFRAAMLQAIGTAPPDIIGDGEFHRFPTKPKGRDDSGYYKFFDDRWPCGVFGDWSTGLQTKWRSDASVKMTAAETKECQKLQAERERIDKQKQAAAIKRARETWKAAAPANPDHPYLAAKRVRPHCVRQAGGDLLCPVVIDGELASLQRIAPDGRKQFAGDCLTKGGYFRLGPEPGETIVIAEGFATGATIQEATGFPVMVAFTAGNLRPVAETVRAKHPDARIVVAGDDDRETMLRRGFNPGAEKAGEASAAVGAILAIPKFERASDPEATDWNDYAKIHGMDAVKRELEAALTGAETRPRAEAPRPLTRELSPAEPFPIDALGPLLGDAARAIIDRVQCPDAIAANAVLAAASLAVQAHADIELPSLHRRRPLSLFLVTVAGTGERKSAADHEAGAPFRKREEELREIHAEEMKTYRHAKRAYDEALRRAEKTKGDRAAIEAAIKAIGEEPPHPLHPILTCDSPTLEGLHKLYANGHPALGLFSDEGASFIAGHAMADEARLRTVAGLSALWDGSPIRRVRSVDGASVLPGRRLALHLMAQPDAAAGMLSDPALADQGFLSRILVSAPASTAGKRFHRTEGRDTAGALQRYSRAVSAALCEPPIMLPGARNALDPRVIQFEPGAARRWLEFADHVEGLLAPGKALEPVRGFANKLAEHAARIAGVLALIEDLKASTVSAEHLERAIALADYYATEALRLFEASACAPELAQAARLQEWLNTSWRESFIGLRAIYRFGPNSIRDAKSAKKAVTILADHGWLVLHEGAPPRVDGQPVREAWRIIRGA